MTQEEKFKNHFDKFRSGLCRASLDHYLETGTVSGSLLLAVREMLPAPPSSPTATAEEVYTEAEIRELLPKWISFGADANDIVKQCLDGKLSRQLVEAGLKYLESVGTHNNPHYTFHDFKKGFEYSSLKEQEAHNRAVQECIEKAESISFDTEDQTGFKFIAVNLDELREKLKK